VEKEGLIWVFTNPFPMKPTNPDLRKPGQFGKYTQLEMGSCVKQLVSGHAVTTTQI